MSQFKQTIFVSIPVSDFINSIAFYESIGLAKIPQFSDKTVACMVLSETFNSDPNPIEDHGFMYGRSMEDPDGHILEAKWMDMSAMHSEGKN